MGKRPLARRDVFGWIAVLTLILGFLFLTSWNRSMQGADTAPAPAPTPLADTATQGEPTSAPVVAPAAPPEEAARQTPEKASADGPGTPFSLPGFDSIEHTLEVQRKEKALEDERQATLDEVAGETIEESVRNLLPHDLSPLFSPHWRDPAFMGSHGDVPTLCEDLEADPRIARLLETIRQGSQTEVDALYDELRKTIDTFLNELPLTPPIGEPPMATVMYPESGNALPLLLAAFPPSVEHLQLLVAMADLVVRANQEDFREAFPDRAETSEIIGSPTLTVLAYSVDQVLSGLADKGVSGEALSSEQRTVLDAYLRSREELRAPTAARIEEYAAHDLVEPEALDALGDPSLLDSYRWRFADLLTECRMEREVLAFAQALSAAPNSQPGGDLQ